MALESLEQAYNLLWLIATGVFATGIGIYLLIDPDMGMAPAGPRQLSDYLPGAGAVLGGLIILSFCAWVALRKKPPEQK